jgi:hypothetical protein
MSSDHRSVFAGVLPDMDRWSTLLGCLAAGSLGALCRSWVHVCCDGTFWNRHRRVRWGTRNRRSNGREAATAAGSWRRAFWRAAFVSSHDGPVVASVLANVNGGGRLRLRGGPGDRYRYGQPQCACQRCRCVDSECTHSLFPSDLCTDLDKKEILILDI